MPSCVPQNFLPGYLDRSPLMAPIGPFATRLPSSRWPALAEMQVLVDEAGLTTLSGKPLRLVPQGPRSRVFGEKYEPRIYLSGEVQTRTQNWHDLFNTLAWLMFPRAKATINQFHYHAALQEQDGRRSRSRDVLTLIDESGIAIACADEDLAELIRTFRWKELFWQRREECMSKMRFVLFGHSLYEKALHPHIGITGKGVVVPVDQDFFAISPADQLALLDREIAQRLSAPGALESTRLYPPVPLLGVPGWWPENAREGFYDRGDHFRTGHQKP